MITIAKEPLSYEDIRTIANIQYPTFRETCFASGFLDGDKEYIEAIKEARDLGWGHYLRNLFIAMLLSNGINRPNEVWEQTWECLLDGILYEQRRLSSIPDIIVLNNHIFIFSYYFQL